MPGTQERPIYESVAGALGADNVIGSYVPKGKRRVVLYGSANHTIAAGAPILIYIDGGGGTSSIAVQNSRQDYLAAGSVVSGDQYALHRPILLSEGQAIAAYAVTGAGETVNIGYHYVEWYPEFEPTPWQALFIRA